MPGTLLKSLSCSGFRNLENLLWEPGPGTILLLGANGAGKTSLLEAIYVLATTRSFRSGRLAECCRHGRESFQLSGRVEGEQRVDLALGWTADGMERSVNGRSASLTRHIEALPLVSWSAADAELIGGGPGVRRRFLDQGVVGSRPAALEVLARCRRALEQKRQLLARGGGGLAAWNEVLASASAELARLRSEYAVRLAGTLDEVISESTLELPQMELRYRPSPADALAGPEKVLAALERVRDRELERQTALVGPHRDELEILWQGRELKREASAGERKAIGLALTAARGRVLAAEGREPVYLLDDLDSELDPGRLRAVWGLFRDARQAFVSSNRDAPWEGLEVGSVRRLEGGRLAPRTESGAGADLTA